MAKLLITLYVLATSFGLIVLKLGTTHGGAPVSFVENKLHFNLNAHSLIGISLYAFSFFLYTYLISKYDLGYIIPLTTAFVYLIIFVASYVVFKEAFTSFKIAGIILITLGLVFLNLKH